MHEQIQRIEQNLIRLERTFQRGHEHLLEVMGSQRERIVKALDSLKTEFRFALLDQEVALRGELLNLHGGFNGLREAMLDPDDQRSRRPPPSPGSRALPRCLTHSADQEKKPRV